MERQLSFNHRPGQGCLTELHCVYSVNVSPGAGVLPLGGQERTVSNPVEQKRFCACYRGLFDVCLNCHNKAGVLERSQMKLLYVCVLFFKLCFIENSDLILHFPK